MPQFTEVDVIEDHLTLVDIEKRLNDQEGLRRASLLAISPCTDFPQKRFTCLTYAKASSKPNKPIELHQLSDGKIPTIPGKGLVCIGRCFVERTPLEVAAFR